MELYHAGRKRPKYYVKTKPNLETPNSNKHLKQLATRFAKIYHSILSIERERFLLLLLGVVEDGVIGEVAVRRADGKPYAVFVVLEGVVGHGSVEALKESHASVTIVMHVVACRPRDNHPVPVLYFCFNFIPLSNLRCAEATLFGSLFLLFCTCRISRRAVFFLLVFLCLLLFLHDVCPEK